VSVSDVKDLLVGISILIGSLSSAFVLVWNTIIGPKRSTRQAARKAATEAADKLLDAIADGEITPDEIAGIQRSLRGREADE
jgi:hypothetical protein